MRMRVVMCSGCPFNPHRTGPALPVDVMETVVARIAAGEQWVCHQTCQGVHVTSRSSLCAGAPG